MDARPMQGLKQRIHQALEANDLETVISLAKEQRRVLSLLVRMAYDKDTLIGWRAIKAEGQAGGGREDAGLRLR
jgi:hypothetical protein